MKKLFGISELEPRIMLDAAAVDAITNDVFHFDAQDIDADGDTSDQPADETAIGRWDEFENNYDATASGGNRPVYDADAFDGRGGIRFDGSNDTFGIANSGDINTSTYNEKSFAFVFETGSDLSGHQVIYEQGGGTRGYQLSIADGNLYAYVWNNDEWNPADHNKSINLGSLSTNTSYQAIMIHDATGENTWRANLNGGTFQTLNNVEFQRGHSGNIEIGASGNSLHPVTFNNAQDDHFQGSIGEIFSWNTALTDQQATDVANYFNTKWFNEAPVIATNTSLDVVFGTQLSITDTSLNTTDADNVDTELIYTVTGLPSEGTLRLGTTVLGVSDIFTQQDINDGLLNYTNSDSAPGSDSFTFTLSDGFETLGPETFDFNIIAPPPADPFVSTLNPLALDEGASATITTAELDATDNNTPDTGIIFEITNVTDHGTLFNDGVALGLNDTFTQQDIIDGFLTYTHNDSENFTDAFSFTVTDGSVTTTEAGFIINVTPVNDQTPSLTTNNPLTVAVGETGQTLGAGFFEVTDADTGTAATSLTIELTGLPATGTLYRSGVALGVGDTFTQQDVNDGLITYDHDGSSSPTDSFSFTMTDGTFTSVETAYGINIADQLLDGDTSYPDIIMHYDAQDIDADGNFGDQPSDGTAVATWTDTSSNSFDATASGIRQPTYDTDAFGGRGGLRFDGDDLLNIPNDALINDGSDYDQKSFALVFETSNNISGTQVIFEQGGASNGYNIAIVDGRLYAYVWGENNFPGGDQLKSIDLGTVDTNTAYRVLAVHDATGPDLDSRTFSASVNGGPLQTLTRVDVQGGHSGNNAFGGVFQDSQDPSDDSNIDGDNLAFFEGTIGEFGSWNHAFDSTEFNEVDDFLRQKWFNQGPTLITNTPLSAGEGESTIIPATNLETTDPDNDPDEITYRIQNLPDHGTISLSGSALGVNDTFTQQDIIDGNVTYDHDGTPPAPDSFTFTVDDGSITAGLGTFDLNVFDTNDAPVFDNGATAALTINEDSGAADITSLLTASDEDIGDTLTWSIVSGPSNGTLGGFDATDTSTGGSVTPSGLTYTSNADYNGTDSFTIQISDGTVTDTIDVTMTIDPTNDAPVFDNGATAALTIDEDSGAADITSLLTATDIDIGDTLTWSIVSGPSNGTLGGFDATDTSTGGSVTPSGLTYTSNADYNGTDTFTIRISDGTLTDTIDVTMTINQTNDAVTFDGGATASITIDEDSGFTNISSLLSASDIDVGDTVTWAILSNPSDGSLSGFNDTAITTGGSVDPANLFYRPDLNYNGSDSFSIRVFDSGSQDDITINVTVNPVNDAPVMSAIADQSLEQDKTLGGLSITVSDIDSTLGSLTISGTSDNQQLLPNGNISVSGTGATRTLFIPHDNDYFGQATVTLTISDGTDSTNRSFILDVNEAGGFFVPPSSGNGGGPSGGTGPDGQPQNTNNSDFTGTVIEEELDGETNLIRAAVQQNLEDFRESFYGRGILEEIHRDMVVQYISGLNDLADQQTLTFPSQPQGQPIVLNTDASGLVAGLAAQETESPIQQTQEQSTQGLSKMAAYYERLNSALFEKDTQDNTLQSAPNELYNSDRSNTKVQDQFDTIHAYQKNYYNTLRETLMSSPGSKDASIVSETRS